MKSLATPRDPSNVRQLIVMGLFSFFFFFFFVGFIFTRLEFYSMHFQLKAGSGMKLLVFAIVLALETWGMAYFDFATPHWDNNSTIPVEC